MQRDRKVSLSTMARALAAHEPLLAPEPESVAAAPRWGRASVALVVRPAIADLELLLIKRASAVGDPWSGHMALPGGRRSPSDRDAIHTAIRETSEEVGIDLALDGAFLGRLDDVVPASPAPSVVVSPFVFTVNEAATVRLNHEVALALWAPLRQLTDPASEIEYLHALEGGDSRSFPALGYQQHVIWGITHRILVQFLNIARDGLQPGRVS